MKEVEFGDGRGDRAPREAEPAACSARSSARSCATVRAALEAGEFEELDGRAACASTATSSGPTRCSSSARGEQGWAVAADDGLTVALDTALDDELVREGRVRDLIHRVNAMRKDAGLEITDRIAVTLPEDADCSSTRTGSPRDARGTGRVRRRAADRQGLARVPDPAVQADKLVREFKKGPRAVDGIDLARRARRDLRLPRPERRRQVDDRAHADDAAAADRGHRARRRLRRRASEGPQVRDAIGAALQEAALDPLLTGREHLRLQAALHGDPAPERRAPRRRAARARRPDRGRRPQGRRLLGRDEAAARPRARARPPARGSSSSTSRRPASTSRAAPRSGRRSAGSRSDEGVTVFLTTQYLEEADVLADRVGIIDHGRIVAEGTPAALKAEIGRPTVEVDPGDPADSDALARRSSRASASRVALDRGRRRPPRRRRGRPRRDRARARRRRASRSSTSSSTSRRSTTSSSPRPAARSRARRRRGRAEPARPRDGAGVSAARRPGLPARPPLGRAHAAAAGERGRAARLPAAAARRQLGRPARRRRTSPASRPTRTSRSPRGPVHPGRAVRDDERRHRPRARHPDRLPEPARADADARRRAARRPARRRVVARRSCRRSSTSPSASRSACASRRARPASLVLLVLCALDRARASARSALFARAAHRLRRGGAGPLPGLLRLPLHLVDEPAAQPDRGRLVPRRRDRQPGLVPDRGRAQPDHRRAGTREALALGFGIAAAIAVVAIALSAAGAARDGWRAREERPRPSRSRSPGGTLHNVFTNPSLLLPVAALPAVLLHRLRRRALAASRNVPGFDFPSGYTAFQFVFVLLQSAAFGGVFTGFGIARDFETRLRAAAAARRAAPRAGSCWATRSRRSSAGS